METESLPRPNGRTLKVVPTEEESLRSLARTFDRIATSFDEVAATLRELVVEDENGVKHLRTRAS